MSLKVQVEDQIGALAREGRLREINYNPAEAKARLARAEPFLDSVTQDLGLRSGGQEDKMRHAQTMDAWRHLKRTGVREFTVVNCMPWSIEITCGVNRHFVKKADWKVGEEFHIKTFGIRDCRVDQRDLGDGKVSPTILLPIEVAMEFQDRYVGKEGELDEDDEGRKVNNKPGGLFVFEGNPSNLPEDFGDLVVEAKLRLGEWFFAQYQTGEAVWERYKHDPLHITERMKDAAHFCYKIGKIPALPGWIAATRKDSGTKECPNCAEQIKAAAKQCRFCFATINSDGTATQRGAGAPMPTPAPDPEPEVVRPESRVDPELLAGIRTDPVDAGPTDAEILNMADENLPPVREPRPNKPRRGGAEPSKE